MRRILIAAAVVVMASLMSVGSPAHAASGPWTAASAGVSHTCAINTAKSLYCWGRNDLGQLGAGAPEASITPRKIGSSGVWASVAAGAQHTCAISTGKSLYCWGFNAAGQIGDGTSGPGNDRVVPKKIGTSGVWATVAPGGLHTCAISTGKSLYCWGSNQYGQIGDGTSGPGNDRVVPKKIGTSGVWATISSGADHSCAITTGKSLYCWGSNTNGKLGDGTPTNRPSPKKIGATGAWATVDLGDQHTCATDTGKSLYCWGSNQYGQVGDGIPGGLRALPTRIGASGVWAAVTAGGTHSCAISTGKSLYCWGSNQYGQIGDGASGMDITQQTPKKIGASGVWAGTSAGGFHTCATSTGSSLYCWGSNGLGQVGDGSNLPERPSPRKIA